MGAGQIYAICHDNMSDTSMGNAHILIVDDDSRVTSALRRTLDYEGYHISSALDGEGALAIARTKPPDLAILALMLLGIDGLEVCRRLRTVNDALAEPSLIARDAVADCVVVVEAEPVTF